MNDFIAELRNPLRNGKVIGHVDPRAYHKQRDAGIVRGHPEYVMSFSELSEFGNCPARWIAGFKQEPTYAMQWGKPLDCMVLTPELFEQSFAVTPETYKGTNRQKQIIDKPWRFGADFTDDWKEEQEKAGREIVHHKQFLQLREAAKALFGDREIISLLEISKRQVMVVSEYFDEETELAIPMKSLLDIVPMAGNPKWGKAIADLKTCTNASPEAFIDHVWRMRYNVQAALYLDAMLAAGEDRTDYFIVAQESYSPWQVGRRHLSSDVIAFGRARYSGWLARYAHCLKTGQWSDYEAGTDQLLPGWGKVQFNKPYQME